jgi:biotin transport system substrate-specific component
MLGISGLAVFSKGGSGVGFLFGPTGGYLIGFVVGAYICGLLVERKHDITGMVAGFFVIYLLGVIQLKYILQVEWTKAVLIGVVPFLPGDIFKILIGVGIYKQLKKTGFLESIS